MDCGSADGGVVLVDHRVWVVYDPSVAYEQGMWCFAKMEVPARMAVPVDGGFAADCPLTVEAVSAVEWCVSRCGGGSREDSA